MSGLHVVVVTGLSGAGRSTALRVLEDLDFFCVDNLPPSLAPALLETLSADAVARGVGLGIDVRTGGLLEGVSGVLDSLASSGHQVEVLFLDCADEILVRRFSESRRPHKLAPGGELWEAIQTERARLAKLRARATHVVDTTRLNVHDLRRVIVEFIERGSLGARMVTRVVSFGFKYGIPTDADLVFDLRHLPNPYFEPALRPQSGLDPVVAKFVLDAPATQEFYADIRQLLLNALPRYEKEGKSYLTIALGCTGGRHRSVATAEALAAELRSLGRETAVAHRDVERVKA
ncbi:MAG: RNase adapter RapZ [Myxococcales bacterium]|nr:RNase adapter RapZ [Myxococcales bacterium]MCB9630449.1 RNase adapter RapZ [Sandaracinaceae bacterium]